MKLCRGWQHDDPADLPGNDSGSLTRTLEFSIPFHGRHGGVLGSRAYDDYWLPVDRIRGVPIEVEWAPAAVFDNAGDITDAVLYINPVLMPYRSVVVGADIRWHYLDMAPSAAVHMPLRGKALHSAGIMANTGEYSHPAATWTQFSLEEFSFLSRVTLPQLVGAWNSRCAQCVPEHEPIADPQFIPIVFQDKRGSVTGLPMFPLGRVELNVTSTETETWEMIMAEVFDTQDLAQKLMGRPQTVFQGARRAVAKYSEKNQPGRQGRGTGPSSRVATRLNHLLAHQLRG